MENAARTQREEDERRAKREEDERQAKRAEDEMQAEVTAQQQTIRLLQKKVYQRSKRNVPMPQLHR